MKKLAIVGASAALAAMPVLGTFAVQDTIQLTVTEACDMALESAQSAGDTINLGSTTPGHALAEVTGGNTDTDGTVMTISCNTVEGWTLSASATALTSTTNANDTIPFGAYAEDGTSVWSAKLAVPQGSAVSSLLDYNEIPSGGVVINGVNASTDHGISVSELTITPSYKAYVDSLQPVGTYSGTITYTFANLHP